MIKRIRNLLKRSQTPPTLPVPRVVDRLEPPPEEGILVISDLHLGEACKEHSRIEYLKRGAELDADFCHFLEHHTRAQGGRTWRLIMGGDLLDFLQVTIVPRGASAEARRFGLGTTEAESTWKLERLMERHRNAFVYLAAFIGAGNRVDIVQGNHDEELFWPGVRQALVDGLVSLFFGGEAHPDASPEAFRRRIHFHPWFIHLPGLLYQEHGHRFDSYCVTPPQLCPLRPGDEQELTQPLSGLAIRYFANLERGFRTHDKEHWGFKEYVAYYRQQGWGGLFEVFMRYLHFVRQTVDYYLQHGRSPSDTAAHGHAEALKAYIDEQDRPADRLKVLDAMAVPSVTERALGVYAGLCLSEVVTGVFTLLALLIALATSWGWLADIMFVGSVLGLGLLHGKVVHGLYSHNTPQKLDAAAEAIGSLLDVPVVLMGHSHRPVRRRQQWDHRAFYVNSGCFLPPHRPAHGPDEPCRCPVTFVEIPHVGEHDRPHPRLKRWCCVRGEPADF